MSTPTKKTWQELTTLVAEDIEHGEWEVRDVQREAEQRIESVKNTVDWDWAFHIQQDTPVPALWDDATEEDVAMLGYAAKFNSTWYEVNKKIHDARQLLQQAYEQLNKLRMEE